jgi:hypothetical protein
MASALATASVYGTVSTVGLSLTSAGGFVAGG